MEIVFNGKTYTKFQRLWNDVHFSWGEDHKTHYSAGMIYCCDHAGNLYRMYEKDFHDMCGDGLPRQRTSRTGYI